MIDKCLICQGAERALRLANLVKLQIQRPTLRLLYDNGADIGKLTLFSEACIVAKVSFFFAFILLFGGESDFLLQALKLGPDWWIAPV